MLEYLACSISISGIPVRSIRFLPFSFSFLSFSFVLTSLICVSFNLIRFETFLFSFSFLSSVCLCHSFEFCSWSVLELRNLSRKRRSFSCLAWGRSVRSDNFWKNSFYILLFLFHDILRTYFTYKRFKLGLRRCVDRAITPRSNANYHRYSIFTNPSQHPNWRENANGIRPERCNDWRKSQGPSSFGFSIPMVDTGEPTLNNTTVEKEWYILG